MAGTTLGRMVQLTLGATLVVTLTGFVRPVSAQERPTDRRVRSDSHAIAAAIHQGIEQSSRFRQLMDDIDRTDGLVYVEEGTCGHGVRACLLLSVRAAGPNRILRILIDICKTGDALLGSLGHELQHAIELLSDTHVTDATTAFHFLHQRAAIRDFRFETEEAIQVGLVVLAEVRASARKK